MLIPSLTRVIYGTRGSHQLAACRSEPERTDVAADPPKWTIEEYVTDSGGNLVLPFLSKLTGRDRAEAFALLKLLAERGSALRLPHSRALEGGLFELRGNQVRIFYMFQPGRRIILFDGMIKKRDKIPAEVLRQVRQYQREVEEREDET